MKKYRKRRFSSLVALVTGGLMCLGASISQASCDQLEQSSSNFEVATSLDLMTGLTSGYAGATVLNKMPFASAITKNVLLESFANDVSNCIRQLRVEISEIREHVFEQNYTEYNILQFMFESALAGDFRDYAHDFTLLSHQVAYDAIEDWNHFQNHGGNANDLRRIHRLVQAALDARHLALITDREYFAWLLSKPENGCSYGGESESTFKPTYNWYKARDDGRFGNDCEFPGQKIYASISGVVTPYAHGHSGNHFRRLIEKLGVSVQHNPSAISTNEIQTSIRSDWTNLPLAKQRNKFVTQCDRSGAGGSGKYFYSDRLANQTYNFRYTKSGNPSKSTAESRCNSSRNSKITSVSRGAYNLTRHYATIISGWNLNSLIPSIYEAENKVIQGFTGPALPSSPSDVKIAGQRIGALINEKLWVLDAGRWYQIASNVDKFDIDGGVIAFQQGRRLKLVEGRATNSHRQIHGNIDDFDLEGSSVAISLYGDLYISRSTQSINWGQPLQTNVDKFKLAGSRVAVLSNNRLYASENPFNRSWILLYGHADDFDISTNFVAVRQDRNLLIKEGSLGSIWHTIHNNIDSFKLARDAIAITVNDTLSIKQGGLGAPFTGEWPNVRSYHLDDDGLVIYSMGKIEQKNLGDNSAMRLAWTSDQLTVTLDDGDDGFSYDGNWQTSTTVKQYQGDYYSFSAKGSGENIARWEAQVDSGIYEIYATWSAHANRATNAPYNIIYSETAGVESEAEVRVNQKVNGGKWQLLGQYEFVDGNILVELSNDANGYVIADAIRIVPAGR